MCKNFRNYVKSDRPYHIFRKVLRFVVITKFVTQKNRNPSLSFVVRNIVITLDLTDCVRYFVKFLRYFVITKFLTSDLEIS